MERVEQHRVIANDLFEDLVDLGALALDNLLRALDGLRDPLLHELVDRGRRRSNSSSAWPSAARTGAA